LLNLYMLLLFQNWLHWVQHLVLYKDFPLIY
jgi:hypothetical protein